MKAKIWMPVGIATNRVEIAKNVLPSELMPTVNMWCAQTPRLMNAIITLAATITGYPKIGLREKTGMTSEAIANPGRMRI